CHSSCAGKSAGQGLDVASFELAGRFTGVGNSADVMACTVGLRLINPSSNACSKIAFANSHQVTPGLLSIWRAPQPSCVPPRCGLVAIATSRRALARALVGAPN